MVKGTMGCEGITGDNEREDGEARGNELLLIYLKVGISKSLREILSF